MAIGYERINSSAARRRIRDGGAEKGQDTGAGQWPDWMTKNALFRPGDSVSSATFGAGVVMEFALTSVSPVRVKFDDGRECLVAVASLVKA